MATIDTSEKTLQEQFYELLDNVAQGTVLEHDYNKDTITVMLETGHTAYLAGTISLRTFENVGYTVVSYVDGQEETYTSPNYTRTYRQYRSVNKHR